METFFQAKILLLRHVIVENTLTTKTISRDSLHSSFFYDTEHFLHFKNAYLLLAKHGRLQRE